MHFTRINDGRAQGKGGRLRSGFLAVLALALTTVTMAPTTAEAAPGATVDLKVLVVAVGGPEVDPGLDLIDDLLDEVGIPYDVVDTSATDLTEAMLRSGSHGFYNGVIITVADTYLPGVGGAGLTVDEWNTLHQYERDFGVREAVLSGWPTTGATPNYGMTNIQVAGSAGQWTAAGESGVYGYVNTTTPLPITDFAFSAQARGAVGDPVVTPYLVDGADPNQALVSHLAYDDGREVLLSTVSNAWFLPYSQVLAYGFVDFATSGLHLGARQIHLAAHIDDLFISADRWDPDTNTTLFDNPYRNTAADIATMTAAQSQYNATFATVDGFKLDFGINGVGAVEGAETQPFTVAATADTYLDERRDRRNYDRSSRLRVRRAANRARERQSLLAFDLPPEVEAAGTVSLVLMTSVGNGATSDIEVCPVTEPWVSTEATWRRASAGVPWSTGGGAAFDQPRCLAASVGTGTFDIDLSPITEAWTTGAIPNYGLVIRTDDPDAVSVWSTESNSAPHLALPTPAVGDPLVEAVVASGDTFRYINHTYTHRDMDTSAGTTAAHARDEIDLNRQVWQALGLPEAAENHNVVITGNHSGLEDDNNTELDPSDDIHYPVGRNLEMIDGFEAVGIDYMAADTSRVNLDTEQYLEGSHIVLLPRFPTSVFYNTFTPDDLVDEYNYIFHERHIEAGQDPCTIPGAICTPRTYQEILAAEADTTVRHMLSAKRFPHFFHIANIVDYDGQGSTLLFDWLEAVTAAYEAQIDLPIVNLPYYEIAEQTSDSLARRSATISAVLDLGTGQVTLSADTTVDVTVTGLSGGTLYGANPQLGLTLSTTPVIVAAS